MTVTDITASSLSDDGCVKLSDNRNDDFYEVDLSEM